MAATTSGRPSINSSARTGKDIELGTADYEAEIFEKAANMVLEITLDLDQQRSAGQQRPDRVAVDILDMPPP